MKLVIVVALALVAVVAARPEAPVAVVAARSEEPVPVPILVSEFTQDEDGYAFRYENGDGTSRQEEAKKKEVVDEENKPQTVLDVSGSYSYVDPDGNVQTIKYVADENGFRAEGPAIPKV